MLGAGAPARPKAKAKVPASSMPAPAPAAVAPSRVYYPPRAPAPSPSLRTAVVRGPAPTLRTAVVRPPVAPAPPKRIQLAPPSRAAFTAAAVPQIAVPPPQEPPVAAPPPNGGGVLPFRRPRKEIRQRRGGGPVDTFEDLMTDFDEAGGGGGIQPTVTDEGTPTGPPIVTDLPVDTGSGGEYDNTVQADSQVAYDEYGEPYSVEESTGQESGAMNYAPGEDVALPDDPAMGDVFSDAKAWLEGMNPFPRFLASADELLAGFNAKLHEAQNSVRNFIGQDRLYEQQKARIAQELKKADIIVDMLRAKGRVDDAQKVLSASRALLSAADARGVDAMNADIRAKIDQFNKSYSGYGVGLGNSVGYEAAAMMMNLLVSLIGFVVPATFGMQDFMKRTGQHIVNLTSLLTGVISQAEYAEAETLAAEQNAWSTAFKGVATVALLGLGIYIYYKWKKRK